MKIKTSVFLTCVCLLFSIFSFAQIISGNGNGQAPAKTVGASEATSGGFAGDVSLFSGTYNSSYTLGSVSTNSGINFTATMTHSSTYASGDNLPHVSGVPYGEGWNIDIPTISMSTEDYNKYDLWESYRIGEVTTNPFDVKKYRDEDTGNCQAVREEGQLHWFAPMVNIPGVASGRMVYKYQKGNWFYFTLHKFERYIEAIFTGTYWIVQLDDGTVYQFDSQMISHRSASNQRVENECSGFRDGSVESNPYVGQLVLPKSEALTWHCTQIKHKNLVGHINFKYEVYGGFDFFKVFSQEKTIENISTSWKNHDNFPTLRKAYKDIFLVEINSSYERLVLDYEAIPFPESSNILNVNDDDVEAFDSLYAKKTVKEWKGDDFDSWYRYKHVKKDVNGDPAASAMASATNPYLQYPTSGSIDNYYNREQANGTIAGVAFDHGFLESPRLLPDPDNLPLGDIYELETKIHTDWGEGETPLNCLFDINLATGDFDPGAETSGNTIDPDSYNRNRGESVYSTFNNAMKWYNFAAGQGLYGDDNMITSDLFVMPNLPKQYKGFHVQIGPANSDNNFALNLAANDNVPATCNSYFNVQPSPLILKNQASIPNNFGIGIPWAMMTDFHANMGGLTSLGYCQIFDAGNDFWWNDYPTSSFPNVPTKADENIKLENVKLVRYGKIPYMLKSVKKQVFNTGKLEVQIDSLCDIDSYWRNISHLKFEYKHDQANIYNSYLDRDNGLNPQPSIELTQYKRNIFLLKRIIQLPADVGSETPMGTYPTTHFGYEEQPIAEGVYPGVTLNYEYFPEFSEYVNSNISLINSVTDPLGKETKIEFKEEGIRTIKYSYRWRPSEITGITNGWAEGQQYRRAPGYAVQVNMLVDEISVKDRTGDKKWTYNFSNRAHNNQDETPLSEKFRYDNHFNASKYGFGNTVVRGPIQGGGSSPRIVYTHNTSHLLWGKVTEVETYDASNSLISRTESEYNYVVAYEPATHRLSGTRHSEWDYYDYYDEYDFPDRPCLEDSSSTGIRAYNEAFRTWLSNDSLSAATGYEDLALWLSSFDDIEPLELVDCDDLNLPEEYCNCYNYENLSQIDQSECDRYQDEFDEWLSQKPEVDISTYTYYFQSGHPDIVTTGDLHDTPIFYESRRALFIEEANPWYAYSFFIKKTKDTQTSYDQGCKGGEASVQTITDYEYYDANYKGEPIGSGFSYILNQGEEHLYYEPSWQLYKKKTYTPNLDAYTEEEHFYIYDLLNNSNFLTDNHTIHSNDAILFDLYHKKKLRTLPYETRVTSKGAGEAAIVRSTYFIYDNNWEETRPDVTFIPPLDENPCGPSDCSGNDDDDDDDGGGGGDWSVIYTSKGRPCYVNNIAPPGYDCPHEDYPNYYCECIEEESNEPTDDDGGRSNDDGPNKNVTHRLQGKLYLKQVHTQVEAGTGLGSILTFQGNDFDPIFPYKHLKTNEILSRNLWGQVVREQNEREIVTHYDYGETTVYEFPSCVNGHEVISRIYSKNTSGQPVAVTVGAGLTQDDPDRLDALTTRYQYNLDHTIKKIIDPNGMELTYTYDEFKRMSEASRNGVAIQNVIYSNWNNETASFKNKAAQNSVTTTNITDVIDGAVQSWTTTAYVDPLGRNVANVRAGVLVEDNIYDIYDQPILKLKPHYGGIPSVDYPGVDEQKEHAEFFFDTPGRSRVLKSSKYGESISGQYVVSNDYCLANATQLQSELNHAGQNKLPLGNVFFRTQTIDEDGKNVIEFTNAIGQKVATITKNGEYGTVFFYDSHGNVKETYNPENQKSEYKYNYVGLLYEKVTLDAGTNNYGYDQSGNLISERTERRKVMYGYDEYGRMISQSQTQSSYDANEGLEWVPGLDDEGIANLSAYEAILNAAASVFEKEWFYNNYDQTSAGEYSANALPYLNNSIENALGRLVQSTSYDLYGKTIEHRWHSYTKDGFLKWEMMQLKKPEDRLVRIDYPEYNLQGSYKTQNVDLNGDQILDFQYRYIYDPLNRISEVYANYNNPGTGNGNKIVQYYYDDVKDVVGSKKYFDKMDVVAGQNCPQGGDVEIDEIMYGYDDRFRLTDINSHLFDYRLFYDDEHPPISGASGTNNYNGNINGIIASYDTDAAANGEDASIMVGPTNYQYRYDELNRLTHANAMVDNGLNLIHQENWGDAEYYFDKIGNFTSLQRWIYEGNSTEVTPTNYSYHYGSNNRLQKITDVNEDDRDFDYDPDGNIIWDSKKEMNVGYGRANLPWKINKANDKGGSDIISYQYDAADARITKSVTSDGLTKQEYYIRSATGQELAVYDMSNDKITWYVYGNERVAKIHQKGDADFEKPTVGPCDPNPPICDPTMLNQQQAALSGIRAGMANRDITNVGIPNILYRIRLCDGTELHLLEDELPSLPGNYMTLQVIDITNAGQVFTLSGNGIGQEDVDLTGLLQARVIDENVYVDFYEPCINEFICTDGNKAFNARGISSSTIFSRYYNHPPYADMTQNHENADRSLQDDGVYWEINSGALLPDEAEWDVSYDFINPVGVEITSYKVFIDYYSTCLESGSARLGLYDGVNFIPVNGGETTIRMACSQLPGGELELIPDDPLTVDQVKNMKLAIYRNKNVINRIYIDVVRAELTYNYICPCETPKPSCTSTPMGGQDGSLGDLVNQISKTDIGDIRFPTKMYRVKYCDGSEHNVLRQEMSIVDGSGTVTQRLVVKDANQLFSVEQNGIKTDLPFSTVLNIRKTDTDILIKDPCNRSTDDPADDPTDNNGDPEGLDIYFYVHDHLGNTRVLYHTEFDCESSGINYIFDHVVDYYPYGKVLREFVNGEEEKFLTTHHERDQETDLDYRGARFYDADIGRFLSLDPLAEIYPSYSPYHYVGGNPIIIIDPNGKEWVQVGNEYKYDNRVKTESDAKILYGNSAIFRPNGYSFTDKDGDEILLGNYGFYKKAGAIYSAPDLAATSDANIDPEKAMADAAREIENVKANYPVAAAAAAAAATDIFTPDPSDGVPQKWVAEVIVGALASYYIMKMQREIEGIERRAGGPQGYQYSLRSTIASRYICFNCFSGSMNLAVGDVWKFGETTSRSRYSDAYLTRGSLRMLPEFYGNQVQIKVVEKMKIYNYFLQNGHLPPGNKIFR